MTRRLLATLIALVGTAGLVALGLSTFFPVEDRVTLAQEGPISSVEVDVEVGRVTVVPGEGDVATIGRTRRHLWGEPDTSEMLVGGVLRIVASCQRILTFGCSVDYRVAVPAGVSVRIRSERGSVSVADMAGMVEVDTGSGAVRLARTKGPVRVTTSAGDVEGVDLAATFMDATTGAGRIRLSLAEPPGRLGLTTGAGNIDVGLPTVLGGYRVDADAGSGKVDIGVEQNPGGSRTITARSRAGNIGVRVR